MLVVLLAIMAGTPCSTVAQDNDHQLEIGGMVGRQSGLTFKGYTREDRSIDAHLSFNASGFVSMSGHVLTERSVSGSPLVAFLGPGLAIQLDDSAVFLGPSAEIGVFFALARYRAILQLVPQLHLFPEMHGELLAAVGLRITL